MDVESPTVDITVAAAVADKRAPSELD